MSIVCNFVMYCFLLGLGEGCEVDQITMKSNPVSAHVSDDIFLFPHFCPGCLFLNNFFFFVLMSYSSVLTLVPPVVQDCAVMFEEGRSKVM